MQQERAMSSAVPITFNSIIDQSRMQAWLDTLTIQRCMWGLCINFMVPCHLVCCMHQIPWQKWLMDQPEMLDVWVLEILLVVSLIYLFFFGCVACRNQCLSGLTSFDRIINQDEKLDVWVWGFGESQHLGSVTGSNYVSAWVVITRVWLCFQRMFIDYQL